MTIEAREHDCLGNHAHAESTHGSQAKSPFGVSYGSMRQSPPAIFPFGVAVNIPSEMELSHFSSIAFALCSDLGLGQKHWICPTSLQLQQTVGLQDQSFLCAPTSAESARLPCASSLFCFCSSWIRDCWTNSGLKSSTQASEVVT